MEPITRLDNSMISDYMNCPRYFYHRHVEFLKPLQPNLGAEFGTAIHHALDRVYSGDSSDSARKAFLDHFLQYEGLDSTGSRTVMKGIAILDKYLDFYHDDLSRYEIEGVELSGGMDMGFFLYIGRMDLLIRDKSNNKLIVCDHKTSGRRGYLTLNPNYQITGYIAMVREMSGSSDCETGMLNQIYYTKGRKGADPQDSVTLVREETTKKNVHIGEWVRDTQWQASQIHNSCRCDHFPKNTNSCSRYGRCPYIDLCCCTDENTLTTMKENMFTIEKWEPFPSAPVKEDKNG